MAQEVMPLTYIQFKSWVGHHLH